ncbi:fumarylacetoacetate hydrolase family protein [Herbiconiux sp. CPCC 203407]|uniref:Fumarylacetoacetate hydrolase family protein n=1 Tax=Herbiconiux oxytropis TaxID=2970915 RepID=A0AA41XG47_9MICO|nr:fumarylacetoacetate hydrolase family protein [Herbiconiux oxytropis]MCS5721996.1 fumarylacetoacetate hydrolase family protein [Herbiconiux oxytropis]MCS5725579.1 fumarylacetoacetate hydrolase family protein [Herbiconiux oxytropis]
MTTTPTIFPPTTSGTLPEDHRDAVLIGRAWLPDVSGPAVIAVRGDSAVDLTPVFATTNTLVEEVARGVTLEAAIAEAPVVAGLDDLIANTETAVRDPERPWLLSPLDLQAVKAAGVTFAASMLERVIEERAGGAPAEAAAIRDRVNGILGGSLSDLVPGSDAAVRLKAALQAEGMWSQYLEVGIGPDAEIFTKAQPMSTVGTGADAGIFSHSTWNNPEPEIGVVISSTGVVVGATLANDINLRDFEGRSALLLSKAKDNNASAAVGPFIRLFDDAFSLADVESAEVSLEISGPDGFALDDGSSQARSSRPVAALVEQLVGPHHQYPDGAILLLGTMFAPTADRFEHGGGFTHVVGDVVRISTPRLGALVNRIVHSEDCAPWRFGAGALMRNLAGRGLLG